MSKTLKQTKEACGTVMMAKQHRLILMLFLFLSLVACVSLPDMQNAFDRLDAVWSGENSRTLDTKGAKVVSIARKDAIEAAKHALEQIGFNVVEVDNDSGLIRGTRMLEDSDISDEVRRIEEPRLQRIFATEIGVVGKMARLKGEGYRLNAKARIQQVEGGTRVSIERVWADDLNAAQKRYQETDQIAPAALEAGVYEFWNAFDRNVQTIRAQKPVVTESTKGPSDWILPPSDD